MTSNDNLEILTVQELMDLLYIGKNAAYQLLQEGQIQAFRIGNTWKIPRGAVDAYILKRCTESAKDLTITD